MFDEEIEKFLDDEADSYVSLEEKLFQRGIDFETAVTAADKFCGKFNDILTAKGIAKNSISQVCADIAELLKHDTGTQAEFLYTAILSEVFLLFGEVENDEQKVELWLEQSEKMYYLHTLFWWEKDNYKKIGDISASVKMNAVGEANTIEQKILYDTLMQYDIFVPFKENGIYEENIGELIRQVNANEKLKKIKPYIYIAVLSRKTKKMTAQKGYMPNIRSIFKRTEYNIEKDNGKNFDRYQTYLELYDHLKRVYDGEYDKNLTDYCFTHFSNLSEWFYDNCQPDDNIPMPFKYIINEIYSQLKTFSKKSNSYFHIEND